MLIELLVVDVRSMAVGVSGNEFGRLCRSPFRGSEMTLAWVEVGVGCEKTAVN